MDAFSKTKSKRNNKKASVTSLFQETFLVASFNISREEKANSLNPKRKSQASLNNFNSCRGIHYSNSFLNSRIKHLHYKKQ